MDVMKELYEKVAKDDKLQAKFNGISKIWKKRAPKNS